MSEGQGWLEWSLAWNASCPQTSLGWSQARRWEGTRVGHSALFSAEGARLLSSAVWEATQGADGAIAFSWNFKLSCKTKLVVWEPGLYLYVWSPSGPSWFMMRIQEDLILLCFPLSHFTDVAFFFLNKLKVCDSSVLSDDGYQFFLATWQSSLFLMNVCSVFLDIDRLQYSVHIHFYMHWETEKKKFLWLALLQYPLCCNGLETNQQYPWGMPVTVSIHTSVSMKLFQTGK